MWTHSVILSDSGCTQGTASSWQSTALNGGNSPHNPPFCLTANPKAEEYEGQHASRYCGSMNVLMYFSSNRPSWSSSFNVMVSSVGTENTSQS